MISRTGKSIKNTIFGLLGMLAILLLSFVSRSIFLKTLGTEFNGLNSLFSNILSVLNLAELGFASSVAYALYKPLSENDTTAVAMIMNFLKVIYRAIAIIVLVAGLICLPFLQYLINEPIETLPFSINHLRIYFSLYLLNTICSYLLAYKRTVISADQNQYIISSADNLARILLELVQIGFLLIFKNYYVFLFCMIAKTIFTNIILNSYANKHYDYLKLKIKPITKDLKKPIIKNVGAMMLHNIGGVIIGGTIGIIISSFVGIKEAGVYGNYLLIIAGVGSFITIVFNSILAGIGNLCATESIESQQKTFNKIDYFANWSSYFTFICFVCLFNNFITIWIGKENTFNIFIVIAISFNSMVGYLRNSVNAFKSAKGLFWNDRFKPIIEAILGISLAICFSYMWGIFGIILGYTLASLCVALPMEIYVLFKSGFNKPMIPELVKKIVIIIFTFAVAALMYWLCSLITLESIVGFILKASICLIIPNIIFIACTFWTDEFKYFVKLLLRKK